MRKGFDFMKMAAEGGYGEAQYRMAVLLRHGWEGMWERDLRGAASWAHLSALTEEMHSQKLMATLYRKGKGVPKDLARSSQFLRMCKQQEDL